MLENQSGILEISGNENNNQIVDLKLKNYKCQRQSKFGTGKEIAQFNLRFAKVQ